jgi:hypothetical protein
MHRTQIFYEYDNFITPWNHILKTLPYSYCQRKFPYPFLVVNGSRLSMAPESQLCKLSPHSFSHSKLAVRNTETESIYRMKIANATNQVFYPSTPPGY